MERQCIILLLFFPWRGRGYTKNMVPRITFISSVGDLWDLRPGGTGTVTVTFYEQYSTIQTRST